MESRTSLNHHSNLTQSINEADGHAEAEQHVATPYNTAAQTVDRACSSNSHRPFPSRVLTSTKSFNGVDMDTPSKPLLADKAYNGKHEHDEKEAINAIKGEQLNNISVDSFGATEFQGSKEVPTKESGAAGVLLLQQNLGTENTLETTKGLVGAVITRNHKLEEVLHSEKHNNDHWLKITRAAQENRTLRDKTQQLESAAARNKNVLQQPQQSNDPVEILGKESFENHQQRDKEHEELKMHIALLENSLQAAQDENIRLRQKVRRFESSTSSSSMRERIMFLENELRWLSNETKHLKSERDQTSKVVLFYRSKLAEFTQHAKQKFEEVQKRYLSLQAELNALKRREHEYLVQRKQDRAKLRVHEMELGEFEEEYGGMCL